jgi:branched-chain amino acid transport system permease protein
LDLFLVTLRDALAVGSLYALVALGYTMVYGILKFINFAHSDIFVLGAWVSLASATGAGWPAGQTGPIAPWVLWALCVITAAGLTSFGLSRAAPGFRIAHRFAPGAAWRSLLLVSVWGWAIIGLFFLTRTLRSSPSLAPLAAGSVLVIAMATCGLVGFCLERLAYKPLRKAPRLNVLITAIGVSLLLQNAGQLDWMFGTRPQPMPALLPTDKPLFELGSLQIWPVDALSAGTAIALMILLDRLVFATKLGRAMRAVSFSERNAALMGIPVDNVISFTFVLGASLAAAAGFLYAQKYPGLNQTAAPVWVLLGLKAFVAAVVGGIGNVRGAMLGGLLIGLLEFFTRAYVPKGTQLCDVVVFGALIVVLLVRPSGLLGIPMQEKV